MAKTAAWIFGAILAIVGIWGFVQNPVLNIFAVNSLHNIVHLASGLLLLAVAMWWSGKAGMTLVALGVIYLVVAILQLVAPDLTQSLLNTSVEDLWLHVALAVVFIVVGWMGKDESAAPMASST
jgi:uncharacterized protein DUF4383